MSVGHYISPKEYGSVLAPLIPHLMLVWPWYWQVKFLLEIVALAWYFEKNVDGGGHLVKAVDVYWDT